MADNITRSQGTPGNYKSNRGGLPNEPGPFIGTVMNNHDPARIGRIQVFIPEFASTDQNDPASWRTVRYMSPFFGNTPATGNQNDEVGNWQDNPNSYGMWFTVPDVGVQVMCMFVGGDPNQGYYMGCIPDPDAMHMVPAIGASENYVLDEGNERQADLFGGIDRLPVADLNKNADVSKEDSQFFDIAKPVHSYQAAILFQQGLIEDLVRGVINSNAYRESPSNVFGVSTPGRPIYTLDRLNQDGVDMRAELASGELTEEEVRIKARRSGHSVVLDDGDINGEDQHIRIRTSKGHQIMMSDSGNAIHIIHGNGNTWIEFGSEGTIDVFSTNSVNVRTEGDVNIHADRDINMHAGRNFNVFAQGDQQQPESGITLETPRSLTAIGAENVIAFSNDKITLECDGMIAIESSNGTHINTVSSDTLVNGVNVHMNTRGTTNPEVAWPITQNDQPDTAYDPDMGWVSQDNELTSIVRRAPTHEPFDGHGTGIDLEQD